MTMKSVLAALKRGGLLLKQDKRLPSVVGVLTGESLSTSWWSHPDAHRIFAVLEKLADHPDVLFTDHTPASGGERSAQVRAAISLASDESLRRAPGQHQGSTRIETPADRQPVRKPRASARRRAATGCMIRLRSQSGDVARGAV